MSATNFFAGDTFVRTWQFSNGTAVGSVFASASQAAGLTTIAVTTGANSSYAPNIGDIVFFAGDSQEYVVEAGGVAATPLGASASGTLNISPAKVVAIGSFAEAISSGLFDLSGCTAAYGIVPSGAGSLGTFQQRSTDVGGFLMITSPTALGEVSLVVPKGTTQSWNPGLYTGGIKIVFPDGISVTESIEQIQIVPGIVNG